MGYILTMKDELLKFRVSGHEKEAFQAAAKLAGISLSSWMRERLRRVSIKELEEAGKKIAFLQTTLESDEQ